MTKIGVKIRATSCGANALRGMPECTRRATSWQTTVGERVALHGPDENSLNAHAFVGADSCNPCAGSDLQASTARAANLLSHKPFAARSWRGSGLHKGREKEGELGENLTRVATLVRWCKFNLVGAVGILVQFGVLFLLKSLLHVNYLAATGLAVEAAVVHNFFWHERFTWADRTNSRPSLRRHPSGVEAWNLPSTLFAALKRCATQRLGRASFGRFLRFNLTTGLVSIAGNLGMMKAMVGFGHVNYLLANAVAIAVCSLVNFLLSDRWVFEE